MFLEQIKNRLQVKQGLFIGEETAVRSAVLIPLIEINNEWHVLFQMRALTMRKQPGDISFPGGRVDPTDDSTKAAAIRETSEELGISEELIEIIGELSLFITTSSFVIYPFVAKLHVGDINELNINKDEVEKVFTVPLSWLLTHEPYMHLISFQPVPSADFPFDKIMNGVQYEWRTRLLEEWFFEYEEYTIWGMTARILKHFVHLLNAEDELLQ